MPNVGPELTTQRPRVTCSTDSFRLTNVTQFLFKKKKKVTVPKFPICICTFMWARRCGDTPGRFKKREREKQRQRWQCEKFGETKNEKHSNKTEGHIVPLLLSWISVTLLLRSFFHIFPDTIHIYLIYMNIYVYINTWIHISNVYSFTHEVKPYCYVAFLHISKFI